MMTNATDNGNATTQQLMSRLLLARPEVSLLLGIPEESVDYLHRMKRLRGVAVGKFLRWRPDDVQRFVDELEPKD